MEAKAKARFLRMSARKIRRAADLIKGKKVDQALDILAFIPQVAAVPLEKTIRSATANALSITGTAKLKAEDLFIKKVIIDGGPIMKRIRPTGMGRAFRIRKRTSHITIVVADQSTPEPESK